MSEHGIIFGALKNARQYAEVSNLKSLIEAVKHAENTALIEVYKVDLGIIEISDVSAYGSE